MSAPVVVQVEGPVTTLTLDDGPTRNALGTQSVKALLDALRTAEDAPEIRVVVFTGADGIFSSGANRTERNSGARGRGSERASLFDLVSGCSKPTIAAISGPAVGGGANLALACDLRVCAEDAWLQWPQVRMGIMPGSGTVARLSRMVGTTRALEWTMTGRRVSAAEGQAAGLHARVVPGAQLSATTAELASVLVAAPPVSVRFIRECVASLVNRDVLDTRNGDEHRSRILYAMLSLADGDHRHDHHVDGNEGKLV